MHTQIHTCEVCVSVCVPSHMHEQHRVLLPGHACMHGDWEVVTHPLHVTTSDKL